MSWFQTVGKAVAGTASVAGILTAAPIFGAIGTITAGGFVVSAFVGATAALIDKAASDDESSTSLEPMAHAPTPSFIGYEQEEEIDEFDEEQEHI
ncbi:hypothetical protein L1D19_21985 [Vibrio natriegens]|uniref:hypothetical protein n=1 Tax=Vibrio natriegens TaxID=691 RepID=UPI001EFCCE43|nr:hypothetical protein [Vibrio natriegens]MCG9702740.1 hypothetical protein [Vibrio natriegens]